MDTPHKNIEELRQQILNIIDEKRSRYLVSVALAEFITTHTERALVAEIDKKVIEVLGMYAEDVFTPTTKEDKDVFNEVNPNAHTRIHCGGIRHGLHQLRRVARDLSPRDDLEVIHVPPLQKGTNHV